MRFLVISEIKTPPAPDLAMLLFDAQDQWGDTYAAQGKIEQYFGMAGTCGAVGILNVDSHEELDHIMSEYPFAPFAETKIVALSDYAEHIFYYSRRAQMRAELLARRSQPDPET